MDGPLADVAVERCRSRVRVQTTQPAGREAWFDPGVFVAAVLDGLTPGARYYYMCARRCMARRAAYVYTSKYMYGSQRGYVRRLGMPSACHQPASQPAGA